MELQDNAQIFTSQTFTGKVQRRFSGVQFYTLKFTANYNKKDIGVVKKFVAEHRFGKPFNVPLPKYSGNVSTATGTIQVALQATPGSRKIRLGAFTGVLEAGTVVQFSNHKKLYTLVSDVRANGEMQIMPNLRQSVQAGEMLTYNNINGQFIMTNDNIKWPQTEIQKVEFEATENV